MNCFPKQRFTPYTGRLMTANQPPLMQMPPTSSSNYSAASSASGPLTMDPSGMQQVPVISSSNSLNHSASNFSNHSSGGLNVSASSFNNSKMDLDSTAEHAESFQGTKLEGDSSGTTSSSSLANVSAGSSSSRNDSGIGIGMSAADLQKKVMLQLNNLDSSYDESALKKFLVSLLKPITPIVSLILDGPSSAKIEVPSPHVSLIGANCGYTVLWGDVVGDGVMFGTG